VILSDINSLALKRQQPERGVMSFGLYAAGFVIMLAGLIYGAHLMHIPPRWITVGAIVLFGIGILSAVKATRQKDPS
jgi:prepilin signal peptidase PulO-like enzyme (type II secretory pathway)